MLWQPVKRKKLLRLWNDFKRSTVSTFLKFFGTLASLTLWSLSSCCLSIPISALFTFDLHGEEMNLSSNLLAYGGILVQTSVIQRVTNIHLEISNTWRNVENLNFLQSANFIHAEALMMIMVNVLLWKQWRWRRWC